MHIAGTGWIFVSMNKKACREVFYAADVIPCEPVETEESLGTAYVGDDLAAKNREIFNKTALDHILSHDDIYDVAGEEDSGEGKIIARETEQRVGSTDFFVVVVKDSMAAEESHLLCDTRLFIVY